MQVNLIDFSKSLQANGQTAEQKPDVPADQSPTTTVRTLAPAELHFVGGGSGIMQDF